MTADKDLLELAAKAADVPIGEWSEYWQAFKVIGTGTVPKWNPLNHNSDAFRLAVKLKLDIHFEEQGFMGEIVEILYLRDEETGSCICEAHSLGDDPAATVRMAIVCAAAKIAKSSE